LTFLKELIGGFWGKLWTLITTHGFLIWFWLNKHVSHSFSHPLTLRFHLFFSAPPHPMFSFIALQIKIIILVQGGWCCDNLSCTSLAYVGLGTPRGIYGCWERSWCFGGINIVWYLPMVYIIITICTPSFKWWG
jgi:hypothetical protein